MFKLVELDKYWTEDPNNHSDTETGTLSKRLCLWLAHSYCYCWFRAFPESRGAPIKLWANHHPVPILSSFKQREGYSNVLYFAGLGVIDSNNLKEDGIEICQLRKYFSQEMENGVGPKFWRRRCLKLTYKSSFLSPSPRAHNQCNGKSCLFPR